MNKTTTHKHIGYTIFALGIFRNKIVSEVDDMNAARLGECQHNALQNLRNSNVIGMAWK